MKHNKSHKNKFLICVHIRWIILAAVIIIIRVSIAFSQQPSVEPADSISIRLPQSGQSGDNPFLSMTHRHYREYIDRLDKDYGIAAVEGNDSVWAATAVRQMYDAAQATGDKKWELEARFLDFHARHFRQENTFKHDRKAEAEALDEVKKISTQADGRDMPICNYGANILFSPTTGTKWKTTKRLSCKGIT